MTHFEDFDRRKRQEYEEERELREALYALNRGLLRDHLDSDDSRVVRIRRIRDEVWALGHELYGWSE